MRYITIAILLLLTSCTSRSEDVVKNFIDATNAYDYEKAINYLDGSYHETFLNKETEIKDINQLREFLEWRKIMESQTTLSSIESKNDTVITSESTYHLMDKMLGQKKRSFQVKYIVKDGKILKSNIDTLKGHQERVDYNKEKYRAFEAFCAENNYSSYLGMNTDGAKAMLELLKHYKESQSK